MKTVQYVMWTRKMYTSNTVAPLNVITFGYNKSDPDKQMITLTKFLFPLNNPAPKYDRTY